MPIVNCGGGGVRADDGKLGVEVELKVECDPIFLFKISFINL